jgi:hypothetical protein
MELFLTRKTLTEKSSIGELICEGEHVCWTLEDRMRPDGAPKIFGETAIPLGRYEIVITNSPRFSQLAGVPVDLPLLLHVPYYDGVRIHPGNKPKDTDGCILVGRHLGGVDEILDSRVAFYDTVFPMIQAARARGELVHITIQLALGLTPLPLAA